MAWLPGRLSAALGVPVIDGVAAATAMAHALVLLGLRPAIHGELASPVPKDYTGLLTSFAPANPAIQS